MNVLPCLFRSQFSQTLFPSINNKELKKYKKLNKHEVLLLKLITVYMVAMLFHRTVEETAGKFIKTHSGWAAGDGKSSML